MSAVKGDIATMRLYVRELLKFNSNLGTSSGRGPNEAARAAKERRAQIKEAEEFVQIWDDEEAMEREAEQALNPHTYIPKGKSKHRPPADKGPGKEKISKVVPSLKQKRASRTAGNQTPKGQKKKIVINQGKLRRNILLGCQVAEISMPELLEMDTTMDGDKSGKPTIIFTDRLGIRVCRGCPRGITAEDQSPPSNMVFRRCSVMGYYNRVLNKYIEKPSNVHFHLDISCLRKADPTTEVKDIYMTDDVFQDLTEDHMRVLHEKGLLTHILALKL